MDCGTTLCTRAILERVGGFDMQFNRHLMGEDNELVIRFIKAGGLMVNNPYAKRFHYLAPVGGSRSKGSAHRFQRWSLRPRPVQSIYYLARRHFESSVAWDAMLQASITVGWKRRGNQKGSKRERLETLAAEVAALPLTLLRFWRSARIGQTMLDRGPEIPGLPCPQDPQVVSIQEGEAL
jgi:GT2 family glycosyltransferase